MKNIDDFCYAKEAIMFYHQINTLPSTKMKEDTGKSMKNELYILWYAQKAPFCAEMTSKSNNQTRSHSCYHEPVGTTKK